MIVNRYLLEHFKALEAWTIHNNIIMEQQKLKNAIRIISRVAKDYDDVLNGYNYIFIYKNRQNNQDVTFQILAIFLNLQQKIYLFIRMFDVRQKV